MRCTVAVWRTRIEAIISVPSRTMLKREADSNFTEVYSRGIAYLRKRDYDLAIQDFENALRLNPSLADAFTGRGLAYADNKGDYDRAISDYDQVGN